MSHEESFVRYESIGGVDPNVSAVASHGSVLVTGSVFGDLWLVAHGRHERICSLHGAVVALQVRRHAPAEPGGRVYVVSSTSVGYIYVHLVYLRNVAASRALYKFRTGQDIIAIALHPRFSPPERCAPSREPGAPGEDDGTNKTADGSQSDGAPFDDGATGGSPDKVEAAPKGARETYDLRQLLNVRHDRRQRYLGDLDYDETSFVFALDKGNMYLVRLSTIGTAGVDGACSLIHKFRRTFRVIPLVWHEDTLAWADDDGTQIIMLPMRAPVAFLPHHLSLDPEAKRPAPRLDYLPLSDMADLDEYYLTSDESDVDPPDGDVEFDCDEEPGGEGESEDEDENEDGGGGNAAADGARAGQGGASMIHSESRRCHERVNGCSKGACDYIPNRSSRISAALRTHGIHTRRDMHGVRQRGVLDVELCWLSRHKLAVGAKNMLSIVELIPAKPEERDEHVNHLIESSEIKLLETNNSHLRIGSAIGESYFSILEKKVTRDVPLRAHVGYTFRAPPSYNITAIMRLRDAGHFSVIYGVGSLQWGWDIAHIIPSRTHSYIRLCDRAGDRPEAAPAQDATRPWEEPSVLSFTAFDPCFTDIYLNDSYVQCLRTGGGGRALRQHRFMQLTCRISESEPVADFTPSPTSRPQFAKSYLAICRTQYFVMNSFVCSATGNVDHCVAAVGVPDCRVSDRPIDAFRSNAHKSPESIVTTGQVAEMIDSLEAGVLHCVGDPETFEGACLVTRGMILRVAGGTLRQHINQFCVHGAYSGAFREIMRYSSLLCSSPGWERFIRRKLHEGLDAMLSSRHLSVKHVSYLALMFIKSCNGLIDDMETRLGYIRELVGRFGHHRRLNVLLGYIMPLDVLSLSERYQPLCDTARRAVFETLTDDAPFVLLRITATADPCSDEVRVLLQLLRQCLLHYAESAMSHAGESDTPNAEHYPGGCPDPEGEFGPQVGLTGSSSARPTGTPTASTAAAGGRPQSHSLAAALVDSSVGVADTMLCGEKQWRQIARECRDLDVSSLKLDVIDSASMSGLPSDLELISIFSPSTQDCLGVFGHLRYGPQARASLLASGILLAKTGNFRPAFRFLVQAQSGIAVRLAGILCDIDQSAQIDVMNAVVDLYKIDPFATNRIVVDHFSAPHDVTSMVESLREESRFLFLYLKELYTNSKLPAEYTTTFFDLICRFKPHDSLPFIQHVLARCKSDFDLRRGLLRSVLEAQKSWRDLRGDLEDCKAQCAMQVDLYLAECLLRWVSGADWDSVFQGVMLALRIDTLSRSHRREDRSVSTDELIHALSSLVHRVFHDNSPEALLHRVAVELNSRIKRKATLPSRVLSLCLGLMRESDRVSSLRRGAFSVATGRASTRLLATLKRGVVVSVRDTGSRSEASTESSEYSDVELSPACSPTSDSDVSVWGSDSSSWGGFFDSSPASSAAVTIDPPEEPRARVDPCHVDYVCSLCKSTGIVTPCDSSGALDTVHAVFRLLGEGSRCLKYPSETTTSYYFCGHVAHELCQLRTINEAIALRAGQSASPHDPANHGGGAHAASAAASSPDDRAKELAGRICTRLERSCLSCLHHVSRDSGASARWSPRPLDF